MAFPIQSRLITLRLPVDTFERAEAVADVWGQAVERTLATLVERGLRDAEVHAVCRVCGCCHWDACFDEKTEEPCQWAGEDLCTHCAEKIVA